MKFCLIDYDENSKISVTIQKHNEEYISTIIEDLKSFHIVRNVVKMKIKLQSGLLTPGNYAFRVAIFTTNAEVYDLVDMICPITVVDNGSKFSFLTGNYGNFFMGYEIEEIR